MSIEYKGRRNRKREAEGRRITATKLYRELKQYEQAGISLKLNGKPSTCYGIASCVREETEYMRDYDFDRNDEVRGIGFDRIRKT